MSSFKMSREEMHFRVLKKMHSQLDELMEQLRVSLPPAMSSATRDKTLRDMQAQLDALAFAVYCVLKAYGPFPDLAEIDAIINDATN